MKTTLGTGGIRNGRVDFTKRSERLGHNVFGEVGPQLFRVHPQKPVHHRCDQPRMNIVRKPLGIQPDWNPDDRFEDPLKFL